MLTWTEAVQPALDIVPVEVNCRWFIDRDPLFSALHSFDDTGDGRSYRNTAHTCYPWHILGPASRRQTTIVLPRRKLAHPIEATAVIVHEIGHVVDLQFGFSRDMRPISGYASNNRMEAFAEAFTAWLLPAYAAACSPIDSDDHAWLTQLVRPC